MQSATVIMQMPMILTFVSLSLKSRAETSADPTITPALSKVTMSVMSISSSRSRTRTFAARADTVTAPIRKPRDLFVCRKALRVSLFFVTSSLTNDKSPAPPKV